MNTTPGIGARALRDVEDKDVFPIRRQTLLLRAPWVKFGRSMTGRVPIRYQGAMTVYACSEPYTIYHLIYTGVVRRHNVWYVCRFILSSNSRLLQIPSSASRNSRRHSCVGPAAHARACTQTQVDREPTVEDPRSTVIEPGCDVRPARMGSIRLKIEWLDAPSRGKVPVVCDYW
ncbi:hypothetical protein EDB19DRAFT_879613 [Suillus lakei]|nr:hypothetical protein EDB19DRAFT_879613 [Suillus lakei]